MCGLPFVTQLGEKKKEGKRPHRHFVVTDKQNQLQAFTGVNFIFRFCKCSETPVASNEFTTLGCGGEKAA